jgi:hypothetical protein
LNIESGERARGTLKEFTHRPIVWLNPWRQPLRDAGKIANDIGGAVVKGLAANIAGQKEDYLVRSLMAYKAIERKNSMMYGAVKNLSNEDIANVAAYYASIKITVEVPE